MPLNADAATPNLALYNLRDAAGQSQQDVAEAVNRLAGTGGKTGSVTANQVSRWERGVTRPSPFYRRLLSEHFGVSVEALGLVRPREALHDREGTATPAPSFEIQAPAATGPHPLVTNSQSEWRAIRRALNSNRVALAHSVAALYEAGTTLAGTGLLANPDLLPPDALPLEAVELEPDDRAARPEVTGKEDFADHVRPLIDPGRRFHRYSHAVRGLDHPRLFENRMLWRLLDISWNAQAGYMAFGDTSYFEQVDVCEALAHEAAASLISADGRVSPATWKGLGIRRRLGDPFDLGSRALGTSTDTLTIRRDRYGATFVLHDRNAGNVAVAGGMLHVMPCGVFQPSSISQAALAADFSLWRNIMREYSEEFLGNPEHDGDGHPIDYSAPPFDMFEQGRSAGKIRPYCLGFGLDALTLYGEILTTVVFDADVYDTLFGNMVDANEEGTVVKTGRVHPTSAIPFTEHTIRELIGSKRLAPAAAACLQLAWQHRHTLLAD
ncbi:MAG: helix-turn-helix transcriptional regulator [Hamadaea sp.]|uniref:helix-turn-helix domain-containing protein n=1 Tax=Hamadaea sp. TaxID=2024425 RepID=UPI0017934DD4|nr:helix-turn-helix transcriptional regulator [Hamadaea sp.]NUT23821.1 helix-turn-helix transcriptional regulator [Hamadaea sp.]